MAAQALAQNGRHDALPAIAAALSHENAQGTRVVMDYAMALLGDKQALADLKKMCKSVSASAMFRWSAAGYLRRLHDDSWIDGLIAVIQSEEQASLLLERGRNNLLNVGLLDLVTALPPDKASGRQLDEIREIAGDSLSAVSPDLRIAASQALAAFGDSASAIRLEAAIAREKDQDVRAHMQGDLEKLRLAER
jgi:HEAT repeat protein